MGRIPDHELEQLKREVSVQRLAEARGIVLRSHGKDLIGLCPFHDDHEPSLVITASRNLWHCLGACQAGGSVIDWVMRQEGVSFRHAVEILKNGSPEAPGSMSPGRGKRGTAKLACPFDLEADDPALLRQVVRFYHKTLLQSPDALQYLASRGLGSRELVARFELGYSNRTLAYRLPSRDSVAGERLRERLHALGLMRESGHEHFRGSLVIPVIDLDGRVQEMYGRKILPSNRLRKGTPLHLYLDGPHAGVFNEAGIAGEPEVILCEALIDALTFIGAGFPNATASYGVEGFTEHHIAAFRRHGVTTVLLAYDRDEAGDRAADRLAERLLHEGFSCFRVQFPRGLDANEYALRVTPAQESLGLLLRKALWLGKGEAPARAIPEPPIVLETPAPAAVLDPDPEPTPHPADALPTPEEPAEPAIASPPLPAAPSFAAPPAAQDGDQVTIPLGDRRYRVRGLGRTLAPDQLKVNLLVAKNGAFHVDTLDLYQARARAGFLKQAAEDLHLEEDVLKRDLGRVILALEELVEKRKKDQEKKPEREPLSERERKEAFGLLRDPRLIERILEDFERAGVVGEETNKLVAYLCATSRKLKEPLSCVIQSSSAAGKSSLMDAVLAFMPNEDRVKYSAVTGQALFYMGEASLKHKILAIVEEEGAEKATYALKLLLSERELRIASTGKDPETGRLDTHEYHVEGPVAGFLTTTAPEIEDELQNRCLVLTVNEERAQTQKIHVRQRNRRTLEGLREREEKASIEALHQNTQRLLRPLPVVNPFAPHLTFLDTRTRTRRDHEKYLGLIDALALLFQYQRPVKKASVRGRTVEYVEATLDDVALANRLASTVLGRSLDELPPQTRRLLHQLDAFVRSESARLEMARADLRFTRRQVREALGWQDTQLRVHCARLVQLEYLLIHHGRAGQQFVYELVYAGEGGEGKPFLPGLIDVAALRVSPPATTGTSRGSDGTSRGRDPSLAGGMRAGSGPLAGGSRGADPALDPASHTDAQASISPDLEIAHLGAGEALASYVAGPLSSSLDPDLERA